MSSTPPFGWRWRRRLTIVSAALAAGCALAAVPAAGAAPSAASPAPRATVVVLEHPHGGEAAERAVRALGGRVERELPLIRGFSARIPARAIPVLKRTPAVRSVTRDRRLTVRSVDPGTIDPATPLAVAAATIGADAMPADGAGVDVAVVDTGVARVPGLADRVVDGADFSSDAGDRTKRYVDAFGHGTHMAGIIAGWDPEHGFSGIAPGARVVNVRVADHDGATSLVRLLAGIDWVGRNAHRPGLDIRVMSLSLGGPADGGYSTDPLAYAVEQAWKQGVAVVVAAGNGGNATTSLDSPAYDPYPIAVGAEDTTDTVDLSDDHVAEFSNRGSADRAPDVVSPGVGIVSLRVPGGLLDQQFPAARMGDGFFRGSGTSQATAVAAGAVARLAAARPELSPDGLKALLRAAADPVPGFDAAVQGAGLIDLPGAAALPADAVVAQTWPTARPGGPWRARHGAAVQLTIENQDAWRMNAWRMNAWRMNAWRMNAWRMNAWRMNAWRSSQWTGSSWETPPTP
ncbi:MAG: peptidase and in kexin sedolisin [Conexibacter sp.]|nr:peptidase and in kexin sedolisin [Conexibacter sp.]